MSAFFSRSRTFRTFTGDCLDAVEQLRKNKITVDLVLTSPPYENARAYGNTKFNLKGGEWVNWAFQRFTVCHQLCRGLTAWVVEGTTKNFRYSNTPFSLMHYLDGSGIQLRKPPIYHRVGIPGSGGPDWLRNDYETIICAAHGKLPWSDNTAMGQPPKFGPGGKPSHHTRNGRVKSKGYSPPEKANPGNVLSGPVGGGHMAGVVEYDPKHCPVDPTNIGNVFARGNEAPFTERLAEFFIRSFCPPGGVVFDPFCGSGTTLAVANSLGRYAIGCDIRENQVEITNDRCTYTIKPKKFPSWKRS
jgi:hypothetical protein